MTKYSESFTGGRDLRRRAKTLLTRKQRRAGSSEAEAQTTRMVQELQIQQIELELQNEELIHAKAEVDLGLEKFVDLYDFAPVGYLSLDERGLIIDINLTGASLLGLPRSRISSRRFQLFVAPQSSSAMPDFLERVFASDEKQSCDALMLNATGRPFWASLEAKSSVANSRGKRSCRLAMIDISDRKKAQENQHKIDVLLASNEKLEKEIVRREAVELALRESEQNALRLLEQSKRLQEKLREVSRQSLFVQEEERKKISRALHDEISQVLVSINFYLEAFAKAALSNPKGIMKTLTPFRKVVRQAVKTVHQFASELRPLMLDDIGLIPALTNYIDGIPGVKGRTITFSAFEGVEALDNEKRTIIYRIVQESLTNVGKHADATVVRVTIVKHRKGVCLEIADNGNAFDVNLVSSSDWRHRLGLMGMRERVEMVGGRFSVDSAQGTGTTIRAEIPLGAGVVLEA